MKKIDIFLLAILPMITLSVSAQNIFRVDGNSANGAPYTTIQAAHDAAGIGDTIQIVGAASAYAGANITKQLVIIGPGYYLGENSQTQVNKSNARLSSALSLKAGSSGTFIMGLHFDISSNCIDIEGGLSNIVIKRNLLDGSGAIRFNLTNSSVINNITIQQNYFESRPLNYVNSVANNNIFFLNNYCGGSLLGLASSSMTIKHNIINTSENYAFDPTYQISNSTVQNNIINIKGASPTTNMNGTNLFTNNLANIAGFGTANSNQASVNMANVFEVNPATVSSSPFTTDSRWALKAGSPAIAAGASGEDCGIFGGTDPYVLSGLPPVPAIYELTAPTSATQSGGLNVTIKAKAHQ